MPDNNLPTQPTPLIGREREVAAVCQLLSQPSVQLLTLTGPGGVGKTRLALKAAHDLAAAFEDGVFFVSLAPISDPALVFPTVAQTLGLREAGDRPLFERLKEYLHAKLTLLVLDNFEQVLQAASWLAELLAACPRLKIIVTSRAVLRLRSEYEFPLPPLSVPNRLDLLELESLSQYEAVTLFSQRAQAHKPDFTLTLENARIVAEICIRLDGLPLAIELAAARIKLLPPHAILPRLEHRLNLLTSGAADLPLRQQTLRKAIDWSYDLLEKEEQWQFRWLAVFIGGCTLEAAEAIGNSDLVGAEVEGVLNTVASLIDKSLLRQLEQRLPEGRIEPRLWMLETIREYGLEQLIANKELEFVRSRQVAYFLRLTEEVEPHLTGKQQELWLERLEVEHDNLRAILGWLLDRDDRATAARLAGALWRFWLTRGYLSEGRRWLEEILVESGSGEPIIAAHRAKALYGAGILTNYQGDYSRAEVLCRESLWLYRQLGDKRGSALALTGLSQAVGVKGDYQTSQAMCEESVALMRELGDRWGLANALWYNGNVMWMQGNYKSARPFFEEGLKIFREVGNKVGSTYHLMNLGHVAVDEKDYLTAKAQLNEALEILEGLGDKRGVTRCLYGLGNMAFDQGDYALALDYYKKNLTILYELGDKWFVANHLECIAGVAARKESAELAVRLFGAARRLHEAINGPVAPTKRLLYQGNLVMARTQLGEGRFELVWAEGQAMSQAQAVAVALAFSLPDEVVTTPVSTPPPTFNENSLPENLTTREVEVLRLLAQGLTNPQIAEKLVISPRTVHTHLTSIYAKLEVSTRSAATRYAIDHKLV